MAAVSITLRDDIEHGTGKILQNVHVDVNWMPEPSHSTLLWTNSQMMAQELLKVLTGWAMQINSKETAQGVQEAARLDSIRV